MHYQWGYVLFYRTYNFVSRLSLHNWCEALSWSRHGRDHDSYSGCPDIDIVVKSGCPSTSHALNASSSVSLQTGHSASTFGYVDGQSRFWSGILAGRLGINTSVPGKAFSPVSKSFVTVNIPFSSDEYLFEGVSQIDGMSGGATINGYGYTGCVHGVRAEGAISESRNHRVNMAVVIPAMAIFKCIEDISLKASDSVADGGQFSTKFVKANPATCPMNIVEVPRF